MLTETRTIYVLWREDQLPDSEGHGPSGWLDSVRDFLQDECDQLTEAVLKQYPRARIEADVYNGMLTITADRAAINDLTAPNGIVPPPKATVSSKPRTAWVLL